MLVFFFTFEAVYSRKLWILWNQCLLPTRHKLTQRAWAGRRYDFFLVYFADLLFMVVFFSNSIQVSIIIPCVATNTHNNCFFLRIRFCVLVCLLTCVRVNVRVCYLRVSISACVGLRCVVCVFWCL